ncbi:MAG: DNA-binding protein [Rhodocyclales bacterium GWA2_65_20]|nr:MAG: DNA-binding protein [Rhodocyclales bacterium GWA2_65_20]
MSNGDCVAAIDQRSLVVADAGPLIHLDELGALDLLADFHRILVPDAVWLEVAKHRPAALATAAILLERTPPEPVGIELQAVGRLHTLHAGEWQALALCSQHRGSRLLTDDTAARLAAKILGIAAAGTIGIIVRALRCERRDRAQVIALLEALPTQTTLHIRPALLSQIITEVSTL